MFHTLSPFMFISTAQCAGSNTTTLEFWASWMRALESIQNILPPSNKNTQFFNFRMSMITMQTGWSSSLPVTIAMVTVARPWLKFKTGTPLLLLDISQVSYSEAARKSNKVVFFGTLTGTCFCFLLWTSQICAQDLEQNSWPKKQKTKKQNHKDVLSISSWEQEMRFMKSTVVCIYFKKKPSREHISFTRIMLWLCYQLGMAV